MAGLGQGLALRMTVAVAVMAWLSGPGDVLEGLKPGALKLGRSHGLFLLFGCALVAPGLGMCLGPEALGQWVLAQPPLGGHATVWVLLAGPITEESLYRGLIQRGLCRAWGPWVAAGVGAAGFAWAHELAGVGAGPQHFLAGLVLAAVAQRSDGWWAAAMLHAAGNAGWLLAVNLKHLS